MSVCCLLGSKSSVLKLVVRFGFFCVWGGLLQKESFVLFSLAIWKLDSLLWFVAVRISDALVFLIGFSGYVIFLNEWIDFIYVFWKIISSWFYKHFIDCFLLLLPFQLLRFPLFFCLLLLSWRWDCLCFSDWSLSSGHKGSALQPQPPKQVGWQACPSTPHFISCFRCSCYYTFVIRWCFIWFVSLSSSHFFTPWRYLFFSFGRRGD